MKSEIIILLYYYKYSRDISSINLSISSKLSNVKIGIKIFSSYMLQFLQKIYILTNMTSLNLITKKLPLSFRLLNFFTALESSLNFLRI